MGFESKISYIHKNKEAVKRQPLYLARCKGFEVRAYAPRALRAAQF